jgi:transcriptional regulator with XRE-family HTH domain
VGKRPSPSERRVFEAMLREMRISAGLTQEEVARRLGRKQPFVSKYESGERRLDILELRAVCDAIGVSLAGFVRRLESALTTKS